MGSWGNNDTGRYINKLIIIIIIIIIIMMF